jgi:hypothetical protein
VAESVPIGIQEPLSDGKTRLGHTSAQPPIETTQSIAYFVRSILRIAIKLEVKKTCRWDSRDRAVTCMAKLGWPFTEHFTMAGRRLGVALELSLRPEMVGSLNFFHQLLAPFPAVCFDRGRVRQNHDACLRAGIPPPSAGAAAV